MARSYTHRGGEWGPTTTVLSGNAGATRLDERPPVRRALVQHVTSDKL